MPTFQRARSMARTSAYGTTTDQVQQTHQGVILRVNPGGLAILQDGESLEQFSFRFDKIAGYRGETPSAFGLVPGCRVRYTTSDNRVLVVSIEQP